MTPLEKSRGEIYEGLAFTFCKAATIIIITQRFALPVAASAAAIFFVLAVIHGKNDTRCAGRKPLVIAAFWAIVAGVSIWKML